MDRSEFCKVSDFLEFLKTSILNFSDKLLRSPNICFCGSLSPLVIGRGPRLRLWHRLDLLLARVLYYPAAYTVIIHTDMFVLVTSTAHLFQPRCCQSRCNRAFYLLRG